MSFVQPLPKSLSPSRLADFKACPRRYQHASIERIPQPATYATAKGRFAHYVFEHLFSLPSEERTEQKARAFVDPAIDAILTDSVRAEISMDTAMLERMVDETHDIITTYFEMEDPRHVNAEGIELRLGVNVDDTPLFGILDRLDRDDAGNLVIVDYKTGALPNRNYDAQTFANTELYAALCREKLGETPTRIRLLYVAQGETIERPVTDVVVKARTTSAVDAWTRIKRYYDDGEFPATPSVNTCRFCAYKDLCRADGVPVPVG
ncbi:MAG: PD-(D/E)XK nuclease family protein [Acidimicrobiales bacterium]